MKFVFNPLSARFDVAPSGCSDSGGPTTNTGANTPSIQNIPVTTAEQEIEIEIPSNTTKLFLRIRDSLCSMQFSYIAGQSGINYITIPRGNSYTEDNLLTTTISSKIYVRTTKSNVVIELLTWA